MEEIQKIIGSMDPEEALNEISMALKTLFLTLGDQTRSEFLWGIMGESGGDKVSSLVHL